MKIGAKFETTQRRRFRVGSSLYNQILACWFFIHTGSLKPIFTVSHTPDIFSLWSSSEGNRDSRNSLSRNDTIFISNRTLSPANSPVPFRSTSTSSTPLTSSSSMPPTSPLLTTPSPSKAKPPPRYLRFECRNFGYLKRFRLRAVKL